MLLVRIWVDGILTVIIEGYVLRDYHGNACDFSRVALKIVKFNF
jgi:hypothetical protein